MKLKKIEPSSSYHLLLPDEIREEYDDRVSSFWLDGNPILLQLSSYLRDSGDQVSAEERLKERIARHAEDWHPYTLSTSLGSPDKAAAAFVDRSGTMWIHIYLVWSNLAVYATISGPRESVKDSENWAIQSLKSLQLTRF